MRCVLFALLLGSAPAHAGTLIGKLELPPTPERPPPVTRGFLDRVENPLATVRPYAPTTQMVIVVEGDEKPVSPPQVNWELVGESFSRPIIAAPAGAEVVIKNVSRTARTLVALEDPKLLVGVINPTGPKSFRVTEPGKIFTITDRDAPEWISCLPVESVDRRVAAADIDRVAHDCRLSGYAD